MSALRLAPHQISTPLPLEAAREAAWRALSQLRLRDVVIDCEKNLVAGVGGAGWGSYGETIAIRFAADAGTVLMTTQVQSHFGGRFNSFRVKRRTKQVTDAVAAALAAPLSTAPEAVALPVGSSIAPIAAPTGASSFVLGAPIYGAFLPAKRGGPILIYAILGLVWIHLMSPFAWFYANKALKDYGDYDPGDKKQIVIARVLGIIGTVVMVAIYGWRIYAFTG